jgi:hypothetical protein
MYDKTNPLTKREAIAVFFAASLAAARDARNPHPQGRWNHQELILDAFAFADSFITLAPKIPEVV